MPQTRLWLIFGNKFFFDIDDKPTRDIASELISKSTVLRRGVSEGTSQTRGSSTSVSISGGGSNRSTATTYNESTNEHREDTLDGDIWRSLHAEKDFATAIAFVRTDEGTKTDVVPLGVLDLAMESQPPHPHNTD